jgi:hypothetical protein
MAVTLAAAVRMAERLADEISRRERITIAWYLRSELNHGHAVDMAVDAIDNRFGWGPANAYEAFARLHDQQDATLRYRHCRGILGRHQPVLCPQPGCGHHVVCSHSQLVDWLACPELGDLVRSLSMDLGKDVLVG